MTQLPFRTSISDTYPLPSNATARTGFGTIWDSINEALQAGEVHVASASTIDVGNQESTRLYITGTTGITSFGTTYRSPILLRFAGALTITHNATTLRCPGNTNITTAAGDVLIAWPTAASSSGAADGWQVARLAKGGGIFSIAEGGTGANTAAEAFLALKQAATTAATGVVELATDSEAQAGTDSARCVTPDNLGATVLGIGQAWQNMTASRAATTTYTNSTGRPILLNVKGDLNTAGAYIAVAVGGSNIAFSNSVTGAAIASVNGVLIPAGSSYAVAPSGGTLTNMVWMELR